MPKGIKGFQKGNKLWNNPNVKKTRFKKGLIPWNKGNGNSDENQKIRSSKEYKLWQKAVFEIDNWTCQKCQQRGGNLHAHHIFNFADYPLLRTSIENGITFCKKCHKEFHKKYGRKNNTKEQLIKFLNN